MSFVLASLWALHVDCSYAMAAVIWIFEGPCQRAAVGYDVGAMAAVRVRYSWRAT